MSTSAMLDFPNVTLYILKWNVLFGCADTSLQSLENPSIWCYCIMHFFNYLFFFMAPNFLALATTLENLGARWLLAKRVNFVRCRFNEGQNPQNRNNIDVTWCKPSGYILGAGFEIQWCCFVIKPPATILAKMFGSHNHPLLRQDELGFSSVCTECGWESIVRLFLWEEITANLHMIIFQNNKENTCPPKGLESGNHSSSALFILLINIISSSSFSYSTGRKFTSRWRHEY